MKIKNHYIWLCIIWLVSGIINATNTIVYFVEDKFAWGILFLAVALACYLVGGTLLQKALYVHSHNKQVDFLHDLAEYAKERIEPFEEFKKGE